MTPSDPTGCPRRITSWPSAGSTVSLVAACAGRVQAAARISSRGTWPSTEAILERLTPRGGNQCHKIVTSDWLGAKARELCGEDVSVSRIHLAVGAEFEPTWIRRSSIVDSVATLLPPVAVQGFCRGHEALSEVSANQPHPRCGVWSGAAQHDTARAGWRSNTPARCSADLQLGRHVRSRQQHRGVRSATGRGHGERLCRGGVRQRGRSTSR